MHYTAGADWHRSEACGWVCPHNYAIDPSDWSPPRAPCPYGCVLSPDGRPVRVQAPAQDPFFASERVAAQAVLNSLPAPPKRLLPTDSAARKTFPMATGLLDYFPDALAAVSEISYLGNEKHNPGEPVHWARGKSMDHADCILRHLTERGGFDGACRHSAALAWRALALLQEELEREKGLSTPRGAR